MTKAFALKHETRIGLARAFSSVLLDRVFDLYLLVVLGLVGFFRFALIGPYISRTAFTLILFLFFAPLLLLNENIVRWSGAILVATPILSRRRNWIENTVNDFALGLASITPPRILIAVGLTAASYSIFFFQCYCCAWALGFTLPVIDLVLIMALTNVIGFLPFSISNIGTREGGIIFFFRLLRPPLPNPLALSWGLMQFLVLFFGGGLIGFICWQIAPMGLRHALGEAKHSRS